jgi:RNA-directed DNA polymerase
LRREITNSGMPTSYRQAEGYTVAGVHRKSADDPARSETLSLSGSLLHRTWEISSAPATERVGRGRQSRHPAIDADEKSDTPIVPEKRPNKGDNPAEVVERRGVAEGNAGEAPTHRTQSRGRVSMGLEGVREAARRDLTPTRRFASRHDPRQEPYAVVPHVLYRPGFSGDSLV